MFTFDQIDKSSAFAIAQWKYPAPYDLYNGDLDQVESLLAPENCYYTVKDAEGQLIAFRCFGPDARVPGGDYQVEALDMGGGLRPDLAGQGKGAQVLQAAIDFASRTFEPPAFRTTVAAFNQRALKVCERLGYIPDHEFKHSKTGREFIVLLMKAG